MLGETESRQLWQFIAPLTGGSEARLHEFLMSFPTEEISVPLKVANWNADLDTLLLGYFLYEAAFRFLVTRLQL